MTDEDPTIPFTIPGLKALLLGGVGSGKTHVLVTLVKAGVTPFIIFTEPGMATIGKALAEAGLPPDSVKWHYVSPASQDFNSMITMAKNLNKMSFKMISNMTDPNKGQFLQWVDVLRTCENFVDDRSGVSYGNVGKWSTDRALCIDSLSGLNTMAMSLIVGSRPTRDVSDWMVAQNNLLGFLDKMTTDNMCHFILTGHLEREQDEISGGITLMASTLGKKLAPKVPINFDEVVMCKHIGDKFSWSTQEANVDLKARILPQSNDIIPDFGMAIKLWEEAGGIITAPEVPDG